MIDKEIPNINVLRLEYGLEKICRCQNKKYEIDIQNRLVWCQICKAVIDPFEALKYLALHIDTINESIKHAIDYRNELMSYKPYLREAKRLESQMRHKDMLPVCPKCNNTFEWRELNFFHNRNY